jgi:hypothetical protein
MCASRPRGAARVPQDLTGAPLSPRAHGGFTYRRSSGKGVPLRTPPSSADALDLAAAAGELVLQPLEAAVEMIDAVDHGLALGGERADHQ